MTRLVYRCYAKLNFTLEVLRRRDDGYHELASLVHTVSLADDLHIDSATELVSRVEGLDLDDETNLVARAAGLLAAATRVGRGAELTLKKGIPVAAGLGGGSSDAATTLVGLNTLWGTRLVLSELMRLAAELGSDVPFFVRGGAALVGGRGEALQVLPPLRAQWVVVIVPPHAVLDKTTRLYAALEPGDFSSGEFTQRAADRLRQGLPLIEDHLTNAFARVAQSVFAELPQVWTAVEATCRRRFFLSGAGPALFALAADRADARQQRAALARMGLPVYTARTVKRARASIRFAHRTAIRYA